MIRTGILSDNHSGAEPVQLISRFKELNVTSASIDTGNARLQNNYATEEIVHSSDIIYIDLPALSSDQIKLAFRNNTHIFCRRVPVLTIEETTELINLEQEAGCIIQLFHPHLFLSENLNIFRQLQIPLLVNIRQKACPGTGLEHQLPEKLLILALLDKSSIKKLDVSTLEVKYDSYLLDIRLTWSSGSIARLILSTHFREDQSVIEFFQAGKPVIPVQVAPLTQPRRLLSEQQAISELIKAIKKQPATVISLNEFLQAQQIMRQINEKLKYRGSILFG